MLEQLEPRELLADAAMRAVLVLDPTPVHDLTTGEVSVLPQSEPSVTAWDTFYVEIWVRAYGGTAQGVRSARLDLAFDPAYAQATAIGFGPAFDVEQTGWIEQGFAFEVGAATTLPDAGDDRFALLARVRFDPIQTDPLILDDAHRVAGPFDLGLKVIRPEAVLTESGPAPVALEPLPETETWAVPCDLDGNGVVDFGDLSYFAAALNQPVDDSSPFTVWASDFDRSGVVDGQDFESLLAANFGRSRGGDERLVISPQVVEAWQPLVSAHLLDDTAPYGGINHDGITRDPVIEGRVALGKATVEGLLAKVDSLPAVPVPFGADGRFAFDPRQVLPNGSLEDGAHTVLFTVIEGSGRTTSCDVQLVLDTMPPPVPAFALSPDSDTGPVGDGVTAAERADFLGLAEPNALLEIAGTRTTAVADNLGQFVFSGVPLAVGDSPVIVVAMDQAGNESTYGATFTREFEGHPCSAGMFLKIDGVAGESTDDKHKDWIEVLSFSHGVSQPASGADVSGARSAERAQHQDFRIVHALDKASPKLALYGSNGTHIKEIRLEMGSAAGNRYMQYVLSDVIVSSISVEGTAATGLVSETVAFNYGKIEWTYTESDPATGAPKADVTAQWDVVANRGAQIAGAEDLTEAALAAADAPAGLVYEQYAAGGAQALVAALASPGFDAFLKIDGVPGESTDDKHKDWIEVLSFSHGVSQPVSAGASTGGARTAERSRHEDFSLVKVLDKASPTLASLVSGGQSTREVRLELWRGAERFMQYRFSDVIVSSVQVGTPAGGETLPLEEVSFNYGKIEWTYTPYDPATGLPQGDVKASWDVVRNRSGQTADAADLSEAALVAADAPAELWNQQYAAGGLQALTAALASPGFDMFLKIDGVSGESTDDKHKEWIEVLSFSHGISQPASAGVAGGRTAERSQHDDFQVVHALDKASPKLALYSCEGDHVRYVTLELWRGAEKFMEYKMSDVIVSSVSPGGSVATDTLPLEEVSFNYGKIEWTYTAYDPATHRPAGEVRASWDRLQNRAAQWAEAGDASEAALVVAEAPSELWHQEDASAGLAALQALHPAYDYFLKIDGVPGESTDYKHKGWIEVLSYSHGVSQPAAASRFSAGAGAGERAQHQDFSIVHALDKASPTLALYSSSGRNVREATLELWRGDQRFMQYKLSDLIVSGTLVEGTVGGESLPLEEVSFNYGKIEWTYTEYDSATGVRRGDVKASWDVALDRGALAAEAADLSEPAFAAADAPAELWHEQYAAQGQQALSAAPLSPAFDMFLKIDGVSGESTDDKHKGWIEVLSYSHGVSQPAAGSPSGGGGGGAERAKHEDFSIVHTLDKASPKLALFCSSGQHVREVTVELWRGAEKFMEYKMSDVIVSSARPGGSTSGDTLPLEEVSFNYGKIEWTYTEWDPVTHLAKGDIRATWDLVLNRGAQLAEAADASEPALAAVEARAELWHAQYADEGLQALAAAPLSPGFDAFLKIDGIPGESTDDKHKEWIEVLSYSHGVSQPATVIGSGGGAGGSQRATHEDFSIVKTLDKASPKLALSCLRGQHIREATLELWREGQQFMEYKLTDVIVSSAQIGGSASGDTLPLEEVSFNYGKIEWTYTELDPGTNLPVGEVAASWDLAASRGTEGAELLPASAPATVVLSTSQETAENVPPAASTSSATPSLSGAAISDEALAPLVSWAVAAWAAAGADTQRLEQVQVIVEPLSPGYLGFGSDEENTIWLDDDAAGYGWFVDPTPSDDSEFIPWTNEEGVLVGLRARRDGPAAGRMDLASVVAHELGHALGLDHADPLPQPGSVMLSSLARGLRRLPAAEDLRGLYGTQEPVSSEDVVGATEQTGAAAVPPTSAEDAGLPASAGSQSSGLSSVAVELVAVANPTSSDEVYTLPISLGAIPLGTSFYVEVWVQDMGWPSAGITGGQIDLGYTTGGAGAIGLPNHGGTFTLFEGGTADAEPGRIDDFGGGTLSAGVASELNWTRLGWAEFFATGWASIAFQVLPGQFAFSRFGQGNVDWSDVDLGGLTLQVTTPVEQLGPITFMQLQGLDPSSGDLWYGLETTRQGFLTLEGSPAGAPQDVVLSLYDSLENPTPLAVSTLVDGRPRIDWQTEAAAAYYLRVSGSAPGLDLRLANLVARDGSTVAVYGTEGEDSFQLQAEPLRTISINGICYEFAPAEVSSITFDGGPGDDAAELWGSPDDDLAVMQPGSCTVTGPGFTAGVTSAAEITFSGAGGADAASLYDSDGDDTFVATPALSALSGAGFSNQCESVPAVHAYSQGGGTDVAHLYDSPGDEVFICDPTSGRLSGSDFSIEASLFDSVWAHAAGGSDAATFNDSPGDDAFLATPTQATLSGTGFSNTAQGFDAVEAFSTAGGADMAQLYDSPGDDTFVAKPAEASLVGGGFSYRVVQFEAVHAYGLAGGSDMAQLFDSPGNDTFVAYPTYGKLSGSGYFSRAKYFDAVHAYAQAGGTDTAYLYGSAGSDTFVANSTYGKLFGTGYFNRAKFFEGVIADGLAGGPDTATLHDSAGDDTFVGTPAYSQLYGPHYSDRAKSFERVYARATAGGYDKAYLYDSPGDDSLEAQGNWARLHDAAMAYFAFEASGFDFVSATATTGRNTKRLTPPISFVLETLGPWVAAP